ncbi:unnamed protein product [Clonostachys rhizophaga]|uniref:Uncharacterized protein n=1 Tax=Clonostachys rhizophaga TaxID=160324 RepID=A0A9N9VQ81_9HYPO|nr:unnamed protein product [Clonostachys rhizophaga]
MVYRYLEEVLKNMHGLEIVELWTITASMAKTLPGLTNLKALSLTAQKARDGDKITALAKVKSLQHFKIRAWEPIEEFEVATKSILLNSRLTLRSLAIMNLDDVAGYRFRFLDSWQRELGSDSPTPYFPALQSLQLIGLEGPGEGLKRAFENAVNFMNLRSLSLERIYAGRSALYRHLADLAARTPKEDIKLRSFEMDHHSDATLDEHRHDMETICRFLGSFGSLTSLHVLEYDKYLPISQQDKGLLPDPVQQAILKHKNLTSLTLRSRDSFNRANMHPYLSPDVIGTIVDSLPLLEEFDFFARPQDMVQVGEALARGRNLTTISVAQVDRASKLFVPRELVTKILGGILDGRGGGSPGDGHFRWGDHSKLRRIIIDRMFPDNKRIFDITSWFPEVRVKGDRRYQKPFSIRGFQNTEREVLGQDVTMLLRPEDMELASNCDWADDVARDMI